jgi:photosystem II stability/assembly factor-like uncharacterized protein
VVGGSTFNTGTILATADGGTTWSSQTSATTDILSAVSCPSASVCFAVGTGTNGFGGIIVATSNGGANWSAQVSGTNKGLNGVSCPTSTSCFAVGAGGIIVVTTNGGANWSSLNAGANSYDLSRISCASASVCLTIGSLGTILSTADGGTTWISRGSSGSNYGLSAVSCPGVDTCFVVGGGPVLATTDGGLNWNSQAGAGSNAISCPTTTTCFTLGQKTIDGGATWVAQNVGGGGGASLQAMSCPTVMVCYAVGFATIRATIDGGTTWSSQDAGILNSLGGISCPTTSTCFAAGAGGVLTTTNGGATWSNNLGAAGNTISCPSVTTCFVVAGNGMIFDTNDGGSSWSAQGSGTSINLNAVSCPSTTTCFAAGPGIIIATVNGGASWSTQVPGAALFLMGISCPTATRCFVVGQDGAILMGPAPASPTNVAALPGTGQATVSWTAPAPDGTTTITGYSITTFTGAGTAVVSSQNFSSAATSQLITGLTNGTAYRFQVVAMDGNGTGPPSELSKAVTVGAPLPPMSVSAVGGNSQVTVSWTAPFDNGSAIASYTVTGSPTGSAVVAAPAINGIVTGLSNGTSYTFTVTATNANGTGPASAPSNSVTPATIPGAPTLVTASGRNASALVSWTTPASNGGSVITGYTATSSPGGLAATAAGNATSATVNGLTNGTAYTFTVTAMNLAGTGPPSAPSNSVTPAPTVPGQVTNVSAIGGDAQATLTWSAPVDDGGSPITAYQVTPYLGVIAQTPITFNSNATTQVVAGLTNNKSYTFRVAAKNLIGLGPDSTPSNLVALRAGAAQSTSAPTPGSRAANPGSSGALPPPRLPKVPVTNQAQPAKSNSAPTNRTQMSRASSPAIAIERRRFSTLDGFTSGDLSTFGDLRKLDSASRLWIGLVATLSVVVAAIATIRRRKSSS